MGIPTSRNTSLGSLLSAAAIVLATIAMLVLPVNASAAERGVDTDLTWGIPESDFAPTQAAITDLGAKWSRLTILWREGETRNDSYSSNTLAKWDRAVEVAEAAGTKIVATVARSPQWASGSSNAYMPPQNPADYADFMSFLANRYQGRIAGWEIWNEQNSTRFWPNGPNAAEYVQLLKAAYPAVKAADPNAKVVFGGMAYSDWAYLQAAYAAGAKGYFDVMATHPYSDAHDPDKVFYSGDRLNMRAFTAYRELRNVMLDNGDDKPMWFTELGWATTTAYKGVTAAQQAAYLTRAFCIIEEDPYVEMGLWYNLRNNHWNDDADSWETQLGLMKTTFERKPSYDAFKNFNPATCPPPKVAEPAPEPPPTEPLPTIPLPTTISDPAPTEPTTEPVETTTEPDPTTEPDTTADRQRTRIVLRRKRAPRTRALRRLRMAKMVVFGRVRGADRGRVTVKLARIRSTASATGGRATISRTVAVGREGRFRLTLKFPARGKWRLRARYDGSVEAFPSRSRLLSFRS